MHSTLVEHKKNIDKNYNVVVVGVGALRIFLVHLIKMIN